MDRKCRHESLVANQRLRSCRDLFKLTTTASPSNTIDNIVSAAQIGGIWLMQFM
jgi:hypothetical protein